MLREIFPEVTVESLCIYTSYLAEMFVKYMKLTFIYVCVSAQRSTSLYWNFYFYFLLVKLTIFFYFRVLNKMKSFFRSQSNKNIENQIYPKGLLKKGLFTGKLTMHKLKKLECIRVHLSTQRCILKLSYLPLINSKNHYLSLPYFFNSFNFLF